MSIDMSSVIPLIHTNEIKINTKNEDARRARPIEEAYESDNTGLQMDNEGFKERIVRDNFAGVGDTYSTKGALVRESQSGRDNDRGAMTINLII